MIDTIAPPKVSTTNHHRNKGLDRNQARRTPRFQAGLPTEVVLRIESVAEEESPAEPEPNREQ
jgi:hypothetical protein